MARASKSQWDFGDLFHSSEATPKPANRPPPARQVLSVTELTLQIKKTFESSFASVWVSGEISNYRLQSSGHAYFVLKDANAQMQAVLFRGQAGIDRSLLRDGAKVLLGGEMTVYEPRGQYQLRVTAVEVQGIGALQAAFERLKLKLQGEGLFDAARKRPLPRFPGRIGLVTSPTGAAIRDVLHVIERRYAGLEIVLAPSRVQGEGAATDVVDALDRLNRWSLAQPPGKGLDVILVTRGGGSLEDLWTFNEESVARAIVASAIPVVSAVGHEIDFTIADFVADFRAATPSAAGEILTQAYVASREFVAESGRRLVYRTRQRWTRFEEQSVQLQRRLVRLHPRRVVEERGQRVDDLQSSLRRMVLRGYRDRRSTFETRLQRLARVSPRAVVARRKESQALLGRRLALIARQQHKVLEEKLASLSSRLALLSPQNVLNRGYSITYEAATGRVLRAASEATAGTVLKTQLASGELHSTVTGTKPGVD